MGADLKNLLYQQHQLKCPAARQLPPSCSSKTSSTHTPSSRKLLHNPNTECTDAPTDGHTTKCTLQKKPCEPMCEPLQRNLHLQSPIHNFKCCRKLCCWVCANPCLLTFQQQPQHRLLPARCSSIVFRLPHIANQIANHAAAGIVGAAVADASSAATAAAAECEGAPRCIQQSLHKQQANTDAPLRL